MSELFPIASNGELSRRSEYSLENREHIATLQRYVSIHIDALLYVDQAIQDTRLSYKTDQGIARYEQSFEYTGRSVADFEDDETLVYIDGHIARIRYCREVIMTNVTLIHETFRSGVRAESYTVHTERHIASDAAASLFQDTYTIETFRGGSTKASVDRLESAIGNGAQEREMLPYDFMELDKHLSEIETWRSAASQEIRAGKV